MQLVGQPKDMQAEIIRINTDARPFALLVALIVPLLAWLIGWFKGFRMMRLPDPEPSGSVEGVSWSDAGSRSSSATGVGCCIVPSNPNVDASTF